MGRFSVLFRGGQVHVGHHHHYQHHWCRRQDTDLSRRRSSRPLAAATLPVAAALAILATVLCPRRRASRVHSVPEIAGRLEHHGGQAALRGLTLILTLTLPLPLPLTLTLTLTRLSFLQDWLRQYDSANATHYFTTLLGLAVGADEKVRRAHSSLRQLGTAVLAIGCVSLTLRPRYTHSQLYAQHAPMSRVRPLASRPFTHRHTGHAPGRLAHGQGRSRLLD